MLGQPSYKNTLPFEETQGTDQLLAEQEAGLRAPNRLLFTHGQ